MPPKRRRRTPTVSDLLDDAVGTAVDTLFDRAATAIDGMRQQAVQQQMEALPESYLLQSFRCTGCKKTFAVSDMEQVHPSNGWGTCRGCYAFMFKAGVDKAKAFAKRAAANATHRASRAAGFASPPPPAGPLPWVLLGIEQDATVEQIKKAYRAKAMTYHPDRVAAGASSEEKERCRAMFESITRARVVMLKVRSAPTEE